MNIKERKQEQMRLYDEIIAELKSAIELVEQSKVRCESISTDEEVKVFDEWAWNESSKLKYIDFK